MKIGVGCDHGGFNLKDSVLKAIKDSNVEYIDYGTNSLDSVDYPDYASLVAKAVLNKDVDMGVLICGTGIGISIAANKYNGIRCAHVTDGFSAQMAREHNNANIMALGGRITSSDDAYAFTKIFIQTNFEGEGIKKDWIKLAILKRNKVNRNLSI